MASVRKDSDGSSPRQSTPESPSMKMQLKNTFLHISVEDDEEEGVKPRIFRRSRSLSDVLADSNFKKVMSAPTELMDLDKYESVDMKSVWSAPGGLNELTEYCRQSEHSPAGSVDGDFVLIGLDDEPPKAEDPLSLLADEICEYLRNEEAPINCQDLLWRVWGNLGKDAASPTNGGFSLERFIRFLNGWERFELSKNKVTGQWQVALARHSSLHPNANISRHDMQSQSLKLPLSRSCSPVHMPCPPPPEMNGMMSPHQYSSPIVAKPPPPSPPTRPFTMLPGWAMGKGKGPYYGKGGKQMPGTWPSSTSDGDDGERLFLQNILQILSQVPPHEQPYPIISLYQQLCKTLLDEGDVIPRYEDSDLSVRIQCFIQKFPQYFTLVEDANGQACVSLETAMSPMSPMSLNQPLPPKGMGPNMSQGMSPTMVHGMNPSMCQGMSPMSQGMSPMSQGMSPMGQGMSPMGQGMSSMGQGMSAMGQAMSPMGQPMSPMGQPMSPMGHKSGKGKTDKNDRHWRGGKSRQDYSRREASPNYNASARWDW